MAERQYWTFIEHQERKKPTIFCFSREGELNSTKRKVWFPQLKGEDMKRALLLFFFFDTLKALSLVLRIL